MWRALQICEGEYGFNEAGIVSKFSKPLAEANISIFNISTYFTDYALIAEHNVDNTMKNLTEKFDVLSTEDS
eukprot:TRINITY_DN8284_c0_g1_i1.p1 TRINITY_DN8284_c0_g1~~TRINITY_DN8284_c0_g1_i1.p1  ORF type:complete len:72 (-),score=6.69 TRINITY_DN8284_c0_g1_i1:44-259(-)